MHREATPSGQLAKEKMMVYVSLMGRILLANPSRRGAISQIGLILTLFYRNYFVVENG
jgi:hypothetical protein